MSELAQKLFHSDNAQFQIQNGSGQMVEASKLSSEHVGLGIYREEYRDFRWLCITGIETKPQGQIEVEFCEDTLIPSPTTPRETNNGKTITKVTEYRLKKDTWVFDPDDQILVSTQKVTRPQEKRITVATTTELL